MVAPLPVPDCFSHCFACEIDVCQLHNTPTIYTVKKKKLYFEIAAVLNPGFSLDLFSETQPNPMNKTSSFCLIFLLE